MFGMFKNLFGKAKDMSSFQVLVGTLCYRNYVDFGLSPKVLLGYGMLTALEEGLRGETDNNSVEDVLESSLTYKNPHYGCPLQLFGISSGLGSHIDNISIAFKTLQKLQGPLKQTNPFKVNIVEWILRSLNTRFAFGGAPPVDSQESYEGRLAIAFKMGLLYFHENQDEALKLAKEPRSPNPYPTRK